MTEEKWSRLKFIKELEGLASEREVKWLCEELEFSWKLERILQETIDAIDLTIRVPAAEYVPAISDCFKIIDAGLVEINRLVKK